MGRDSSTKKKENERNVITSRVEQKKNHYHCEPEKLPEAKRTEFKIGIAEKSADSNRRQTIADAFRSPLLGKRDTRAGGNVTH